jgi:HAD superfamily hydrolase (TIGR01490 family)|tara:strand:+ start:202 stop:879 length:678 start_codon:yes stop_codon:yes gene_type:complete
MDHTVLGIDSDHSWKYFLADEGFAPLAHRDEADRFLDLYHKGRTPINEFIEFQLSEFAGRSITEIRTIADKHFEQRVRKLIYLQARNVIDKFNHDEIDTILLTGTNRIIANPIAKSLDVSRLIATEPEIEDGYFTGRIDGPFLMKEAKFKSAKDLCLKMNIDLNKVTYFADSITDVPLLEKVGYPVVINPRKDMRSIAKANQWQIKYWFNDVNFLAQPKKTNFRL